MLGAVNSRLVAALAMSIVSAEQGGDGLVLHHDIGPRYNRTDYESACGSTVFRVRFRNGPEEHGRVDHLLIDGRPVRNAAETLQVRAARRVIVRIGIMNCGVDPQRPLFQGAMVLSEMESRRLGMRDTLFFRLTRDGRDWHMTID